MGRKKRRSVRDRPVASVDEVDATGDVGGSVGAAHGAPPAEEAKASRMRPCGEVQSSWFPEVKWVSSRRDSGSQKPEGASPIYDTSASNLPRHTELSPPRSAGSATQPMDSYHSTLLSELNELKQQLMPAAKSCADAINESQHASTTTPEYEYRQARSICNPYERLGETFSKNYSRQSKKKSKKRRHQQQHSSPGLSQFINRSAIKLANIDSLLGYPLTAAATEQQSAKGTPEPFVFVDLCGAPGGFSEYVLYRHMHPVLLLGDRDVGNDSSNETSRECNMNGIRECYGFGMSLLGKNDDGKGARWDLAHLKRHHLHTNDATPNTNVNDKLLHYHVCNGSDGTGSIYNWENVLHLQREIDASVSGEDYENGHYNPLASLVVADGGFDAQRDSNNQEAIAHRIVVSQTAAALSLLLPGGIFVLKMFGFREDITRRMLRYLYGCFDKMAFVKPVLSRPASAERYLVCHGYRGSRKGWDGLVWREQMLESSRDSHEKEDYATSLDELMDSFDLDMLQLNIATCRSIINFLDEKRNAKQQGVDATAHNARLKHYLEPRDYETAWRLL